MAIAIGLFIINATLKPKQQTLAASPQTAAMLNDVLEKKTTTDTEEVIKTPIEPTKKVPSPIDTPTPPLATTSAIEDTLPPVRNDLLPPVGEEMQSTDIITNLWEDIEPDTRFSDFPPEADVKPVSAIRLSEADLIGTLKEGDLVKLPMIQGEEYTATITETKNFENGSSSVTGSYELNGDKHTVTLTQGIKTGFGTFSTPNGTYQISLLGGKGYIYSSDDLDAQRIDTTKPDTLIPPEE